MRTKQELYQAALRTVALRRQTARALAQDAQAQAEAAIPALRHAEEEVRVRGIRCAIAGASGKDRTETAAALAAAKQKLTALLEDYKKAHNGQSVYSPTFIEDLEPAVKELQAEYGFTYTVETAK